MIAPITNAFEPGKPLLAASIARSRLPAERMMIAAVRALRQCQIEKSSGFF
jgi:hypothetical protein